MTALGFFPSVGGGLYKRTSYPLLFRLSRANRNSIRELFVCAKPFFLKVTWVSSSQVRVLLVSLELAVVEIEVESNVTAKTVSP